MCPPSPSLRGWIVHDISRIIDWISDHIFNYHHQSMALGIPSIAVSMCSFEYDDFTFACSLVKKIAEKVLLNGLPEGVMLNINIPPLKCEEIKGIKITKQAHSRFIEEYIKKGEKDGYTLFALTGKMELVDTNSNNDEQAVSDGYVSITPLKLDLTSFSSFEDVRNLI